jgi:hypothetical protein
MMKFINTCEVGFVYNNKQFYQLFKDLCVQNHEVQSINNFVKKKKFTTALEYKTFLRAVNFPRVNQLNDTVIDLGLGNITEQDIKIDEKKISQFNKESSSSFVESIDFLKTVKHIIKKRFMAINEFNVHVNSFLVSENGWTFSQQLFEKINDYELLISPINGITVILNKAINGLQRCLDSKTKKYEPVYRTICTLFYLCNIIRKCFLHNKWNKIKGNEKKRIVQYIPLTKSVFGGKKFSKQLAINKLIRARNEGKQEVYKMNPDLEVKLFNRWSYLKFRNYRQSIYSQYVFNEFTKYVRSIFIGENRKLFTHANNARSRTRARLRKNMFFLQPIKDKGRKFVFVENGTNILLNSEGYYTLE